MFLLWMMVLQTQTNALIRIKSAKSVQSRKTGFYLIHHLIPAEMSAFVGKDFIDEEALVAANFSASELKKNGYSLKALVNCQFSTNQLKEAEYDAISLRCAGISATSMRLGGFHCLELSKAGFNHRQLRDAGYEPIELKEEMLLNCDELKVAGYNCAQL